MEEIAYNIAQKNMEEINKHTAKIVRFWRGKNIEEIKKNTIHVIRYSCGKADAIKFIDLLKEVGTEDKEELIKKCKDFIKMKAKNEKITDDYIDGYQSVVDEEIEKLTGDKK